MNTFPSVSIILVNFNGKELLARCIESILEQKYPKNKIEVIVVDNASTDGSVNLVKRKYPFVKVISLRTNKGFTGGNNKGIEKSTGEYLVLLNNDTKVTPQWLSELVIAAQPKQVGLVSSKLLLDTPFVELVLESSLIQLSDFSNTTDFSPRGVMVENVVGETAELTQLIWYDHGFTDEAEVDEIPTRWTTGPASMYLPVVESHGEFQVTMHGYPSTQDLITQVSAKVGGELVFKTTLHANEVRQLSLDVNKSVIKKHSFYLVQNAGNILLRNGYGKDRGSVTRITKKNAYEHYEKDSLYFHEPHQIFAVCGAACLIKREVIDLIGKLDDRYFMYYEDLEISLRAWRMGWDSVYAPKAVVYHKHRATTGKNSSAFFIHMVEKNHLFFVITHFPPIVVFTECIKFAARILATIVKQQLFRFRHWELYHEYSNKAQGGLEAFAAIRLHWWDLFRSRAWWQKHSTRSYSELEKRLY